MSVGDGRARIMSLLRQGLGRGELSAERKAELKGRFDVPKRNLVPARSDNSQDARVALFAEMAATTLCKYGVSGVKLHTGDVAVLLFAVRANTHLASRDALHRSCVIKQDFRRSESRVDLDAHAFSLLG